MFRPNLKHLGIASAALLLQPILSAQLQAAVMDTWYLDSDSVCGDWSYCGSGDFDPTYTSDNGLTFTASAWHAEEGDPLSDVTDYIKHWDGMALDRDNDDHTIDNMDDSRDGRYNDDDDYELIALEFEEAVSLQSFSFAYTESDSDATVMYQSSGSGSASSSLGGTTMSRSSLTSAGYDILGHVLDHDTGETASVSGWTGDNPSTPGTDETIYSKIWIIGAYVGNSIADSSDNWTSGYYGGRNDGFKLASVTTMRQSSSSSGGSSSGGEVPTPMTALLMLAGLGSLWQRSRRTQSRTPSLSA